MLMAVLAALGYLGYRALLGLGIFCLLFTVAANFPWLHDRLPANASGLLTHLSFDTLEVPFLLIGSMLYRVTRGDNFIRGSIYVVLAVAVFLAARYDYLAEHGDSGGVDLRNGAWALGLFVLALWSGMTWRWIRPLKWIADISYPLYLVHVPLGWICLAWLAGQGFGMLSASVIGGAVVIVVAWLVHVIVEVRAQLWGSYISRALVPSIPRDIRPIATVG
jgi:peptidoglycan/LPS O-acetylase OafA/YrhL